MFAEFVSVDLRKPW